MRRFSVLHSLGRGILAFFLFVILSGWQFASAQSVTIDFENFDLGGGTFLDVSENLVLMDVGSSGVDVTINAGTDNRIYDLFLFGGYSDPGPQALIDWPWPSGSNGTGTCIEFSSPVSDVSLIAGDFGSDDDSPLMITAFDPNNNVVGTDSVPWPATSFPPFATLSVSGSNIAKVVYSSGGAFAGSTFIDNISFTPEGLNLAVSNLVAGGVATFTVSGATPGGTVGVGYSLVGAGPTTVSVGGCTNLTALLTNPILLSLGTADASGVYTFSVNVPGNASGVPVWFHAGDLAACETSNGLSEVVN